MHLRVIKLRAERKAGEFLVEMKEKGTIRRGNPQFQHDVAIVKLEDLNVKPQESKRWQRISSIPEEFKKAKAQHVPWLKNR